MQMQEVRNRKRQEVLLTDVTKFGHLKGGDACAYT